MSDPSSPAQTAQPTTPPDRSIPIPQPAFRRLRVYAFDPSADTQLSTAVINRVTVKVLWEEKLQPGPVGEYLEVVDFDPASNCFYAPVDLNDRFLLAEDGIEPSDGNPKFHQQMVYAVAMTTIRNFEKALGRKALWSPRSYDPQARRLPQYVQRLRIYPHALREANAYYSPNKKALLFGYFPASSDDPGNHLPGGTVFTCLSHDVVAHETTHALLDGMHRRFNEPSNLDALAFHEAFADIVALFQHFTFPEVLRHQLGKSRGNLANQSLLGQLAQEFGQATGRYGALRDALGEVDPQTKEWKPKEPDPTEIDRTLEPHARGAILVAAVFDAFLSIYKTRVEDLLRIATGGTGILPEGELHPDLISRLASEAAKSAQHVLNMCIRALDYCPPVDLTYGEFLRALITADYELVRDDVRGYRVAVIEAFRRRGIYPREIRTLSVDSLLWQKPRDKNNRPTDLKALVEIIKPFADKWTLTTDRAKVYEDASIAREELHNQLFSGGQDILDEKLQWQMGLDLTRPEIKKEVHSIRPARRVGPDGDVKTDLVIEITQQRPMSLNGVEVPGEEAAFSFRGGCTLIVDMENGELRYCIAKNINSASRLSQQIKYLNTSGGDDSLAATYFGNPLLETGGEPFAFLHRKTVDEETPWSNQ